MFKNIIMGILVALLVVALGTAAFNVIGVSAANDTTVPAAGFGVGNNGQGGPGVTPGNGNRTGINVLTLPSSELSSDEAAALLFMREEEKLARDVYNALYVTWQLPIYQNIAASEQTHMDQIGLLLTRYNLTDPARAAGVFTNANLQALYTKLIAQGNLSIGDALKVGGAIEEIDIKDLQTRLTQTDNADIQQVYNSLMNGSFNHLNAFVRNLSSQTGESYVPQYLTVEQYQMIISSGMGNGTGRPDWAGNGNAKGNGRQ